jgi:hypothetical protein
MAKKNSKPKLFMTFSAAFSVNVPEKYKDVFLKDLKRKELSLKIEMEYGDNTSGQSIYPDDMKSGLLEFSTISGQECNVKIDGVVERVVNISVDKDLIEYLRSNSEIDVRLEYVMDLSGNEYHVDGDHKNIVVGKCEVAL